MARLLSAIVLSTAVAILSGCAVEDLFTKPEPDPRPANLQEPEPVVIKTASTSDKLLLYYRRVVGLPKERLQEELRAAESRAKQGGDWEARLQYALLLLHPETPFRDTVKASALLEGLEKEKAETPDEYLLLSLSRLLRGILEEERKAFDSKQTLARKLEASEKELHHVRDQINALKSIEKSLYERTKVSDGVE